jgi:Na+/proline symporter
MLLINVFVLPIAVGGLLHFGPDKVNADSFVLSLPLALEQPLLALAAFIGGLSAATGMVIVEAIAVSTMVCNDLVMPLLLRTRRFGSRAGADVTGVLLGIRRAAIFAVLLLGYLYFHLAGETVRWSASADQLPPSRSSRRRAGRHVLEGGTQGARWPGAARFGL